jgi:hypothetical protein
MKDRNSLRDVYNKVILMIESSNLRKLERQLLEISQNLMLIKKN